MSAILGLTMATPAVAMDTLDQQQAVPGTTRAILGGGVDPVAQTVGCDLDGYLSEVRLPLMSFTGIGWFEVEIRQQDPYPEPPSGKVRAWARLPASVLPRTTAAWVTIPFYPPIPISDTMEYSIAVRALADVTWMLGPDWMDVYPDGDAWAVDASGGWEPWFNISTAEDFMFETWMVTTNTSFADVDAAVEGLAMSIESIPASNILGGSAGQDQLMEQCFKAQEEIASGQYNEARGSLQFILDRSDERPPTADWVLKPMDAIAIWREAMDAWSMIGFLE